MMSYFSLLFPFHFLFLFLFLSPSTSQTLTDTAYDIDNGSWLPALNRTSRQSRVQACGDCAFSLCGFQGVNIPTGRAGFTILNAPLKSSFPYICRTGVPIGRILETAEAQVATSFSPDRFTPISSWKPPGLRKKFPKDFITAVKVPYYPWSGIARQKTAKVFRKFLHDRCMLLPIRKYEILTKSRLVRKTVSVSGKRDCVAFRTTAPQLYLELIWDSLDDLDLSVIEPDSDTLDYRTPNLKTQYGKLDFDLKKQCDPILRTGRERISYFPNPNIEKGSYVVQVSHFRNCTPRMNKPTTWRLLIVKDGVLNATRYGMSDGGNAELVYAEAFDFP